MLIPLLMFLAAAIDLEDDRLLFELDVGDDDAVAGLGREAVSPPPAELPADRWE